MKNNKIIIIIITVLIIIALAILGILVTMSISNNKEVANQNIENQNKENVTNNQVENTLVNEPEENINVIEPIIEPSNPDNNIQPTESFVSTYYYNQLDDVAKTIYTGLKKDKDKLISGNHSVDYGTEFNTLLNSEGGQDKLTQAFQDACTAFSYDNVDLFYIDMTRVSINIAYQDLGGIRTYKVSVGPRSESGYYLDGFKTQEQLEQAKKYIEDIKRQMSEQISADGIYQKLGKVHNWLIETITYEANSSSHDQYTVYGALVKNKAVCEGYARTFKYLMDATGVPCILISGTATNSQGQEESHAWNYVQVNENWYAVDVTWDDPIMINGGELPTEVKYKYFLKGSEEFEIDHKENGRISENGKQFKFPTLSKQNYRP